MADILKAVRSRLLSTTSVTSLVSTRVYPTYAEQSATLPYVVLREVSNFAEENLAGTSGLSTSRVQVDCYALTHGAAYALREACRQQLHAYRGTSESVVFRASVQGSRFGTRLEPRDGSDHGKHIQTIDFLFTHSETAVSS